MATSTRPQTVAQTTRCPRCLGTDIDHSPAETWCRACGFVIEDSPVDHGPEWRSFADDETNPERTYNGNPNHADRGLGTEMQSTLGSDPDDRRRQRINNHVNSGDRTDRNRGYATTEIQRMGTALELPQYAVSRAKFLFRQIHRQGLNGYDLDAVSAACLVAACREDGLGRTVSDVAGVARADERQIGRRYRWVASELSLQIAPPDPLDRLSVVAGELGVVGECRQDPAAWIDALDATETVGVDPSVVVAAVLDVVTDRTQREVCGVAGVSAAGMRQFRDEVLCSG